MGERLNTQQSKKSINSKEDLYSNSMLLRLLFINFRGKPAMYYNRVRSGVEEGALHSEQGSCDRCPSSLLSLNILTITPHKKLI